LQFALPFPNKFIGASFVKNCFIAVNALKDCSGYLQAKNSHCSLLRNPFCSSEVLDFICRPRTSRSFAFTDIVNKALLFYRQLSSLGLQRRVHGSMRHSEETLDTAELPHHLRSTPTPPGFMQERGSGALSAPPPPGFSNGSTVRPTFYAGAQLNPNAWSNQDSRTISFTNLAAVIGTGLAESMEDSTKDAYRDSLFSQDLSYARQSRHAASRMIGNTNSAAYPGGSLLTQLSSLPQSKKVSNTPLHASGHTDKTDPNADEGFYSVDNDPMVEFKVSTSYRPGIFPTPKDVGLEVMEPIEMGRRSAPPVQSFRDLSSFHAETPGKMPHDGTPDLSDLRRRMDHMSLESNTSKRSLESIHAEIDLAPFLWDVRSAEPSRSLVILRAFSHPDIRMTCEAFGVLENFRADFVDRGIIFVEFFDMRAAQYAAMELKACLRRMTGFRNDEVDVKFCVPLSSSSAFDESLILLSDLPANTDEDRLTQIMSSFGSIRSVSRQEGSRYGNGRPSYAVEFYNVQDAKQAILELGSTQPWGPEVLLESGSRSSSDRKKGRELLALLGRWRHGMASIPVNRSSNISSDHRIPPLGVVSHASSNQYSDGVPVQPHMRPASQNRSRSESPMFSPHDAYTSPNTHPFNTTDGIEGNISSNQPQQAHQLVVGPDGRYSYVVMNHSAYAQGHNQQQPHSVDPYGVIHTMHPPPSAQNFVPGSNGRYISTSVHGGPSGPYSIQSAHGQRVQQHLPQPPPPSSHHIQQYHHPGNNSIVPNSYQVDGHGYTGAGVSSAALPYYTHVATHAPDPCVSSENINNAGPARGATMSEKDNRHLMLLLDAVDSGRDTRTSLMVRNIPNKYTQQMLLAEFAENGHGPGKIDFFYLPIDFKNKCNRGYAFINFVDFRDIIPFHQQYFGQHWRVFNSDKICDITYARIQGKSGMLKRFENSALMEKDEEYKPLVFGSHGQEKGQRLPFPSPHASP